MRTRVAVVLAFAMLFGVGTVAWAQQTGSIFGKVADASGAVMPGVTVTLSGPGLQPITAVSSETGSYQFPRLAIGAYTLKFELTGFKTIVREAVRVEINANVQVNATMEISTVEETVTVTGETPLVDLRDTSKGQRFNQEALQSIPSARDPWVILEQTAGIVMDRQNVGGSQSGQQSNYMARGAYWNQSKWNLEGVDITDMSALGASPVYYDFDMLEEMQVTTGGADASAVTAGVQINLVTKSGTDKLKGSGRMYFTPEALEAVNVTDDLRKQGARTGNPIQDIKDVGFEVGGPIKPGKAWFWGSFGKQDIKVGVEGFYKNDTDACREMKAYLDPKAGNDPTKYAVRDIWQCLATDLTTLNNYNVKVGYQLATANRLTGYASFAEKVRNARDASDLRPLETTYRQGAVTSDYGPNLWKTGIPSTYKIGNQHIFSDRLMAEVQWAHIGNNFTLDFHEPGLKDVQPSYEISSGLWGRSYQNAIYMRPVDSIDLTVNYFLPGFAGGDHSFKAGYRWRQAIAYSEGNYGAGTIARFGRSGKPLEFNLNGTTIYSTSEARMYRQYITEYGLYTQAFYAQDTFTRGRLTLNLGFRWDRQTDDATAASVEGHEFQGQTTLSGTPFNFLPGVKFDGANAGVVFNDFSPRLGLIYDISGNGTGVVKANYARYYGQISTGGFSGVLNPVGSVYITFPWFDLNSDGFVQANEVDSSVNPLTVGGNYDWRNPTSLKVSNKVDSNFKNEVTDEFVVSYDRQIGAQFGFGVSYIYRKYRNFQWDLRDGWDSSVWTVEKTYTPPPDKCPSGSRCEPVTYWEPTIGQPATYTRMNRPDYYRDFNGFEVSAQKRMSNRWMATASVAYNSTKQHYPTNASYNDPTNIAQYDGFEYAPETSASGIDNVFVGARWAAKLTGAYQLPWQDIGVAGFWNAREGYPLPLVVQTESRANQAGIASVLIDNFGDTRLPTFQTVDLRIDKPFTLFNRLKIQASMDIFNLFNSDTILARRRVQNANNANNVSQILAPRVMRFGFRATF